MNDLLAQAHQYAQEGKIEEWIHQFLLSSGNNVALSEGLKKQERFWIGPVEYDFSNLIRIGGPEAGMEYPEDEESWNTRIEAMRKDILSGWQPAPLIVEYKNKELKVRDGGHRLAALQKAGYRKYWIIVWANTAEDRLKLNFSKIIPTLCARDTSSDPEHWSEENPLWGHCAVVSLLAQDQFGGTMIRQSLEGIDGLEYIRSHYSNKLLDGTDIDFTLEQFREDLPANLPKEERSRERILSYPDTQKRYELLKSRFEME